MAAGTFSPSALLNIQLKAESMWSEGQFSTDLVAESEAAQAVLRNQTARLTELTNPEKENTAVVTWIKTCDIVDEACETNCDLDEPELETVNKSYELDMCRKSGFSVDAFKLRTNTYEVEELAARGLAAALKELDEWWAKQALLKLKTFQGVNVKASPHTWDAANLRTSVAGASYNRTLVPYLMQTAIMNRMKNSYFISNEELWYDWQNALFDAGNLDGKGAMARIAALGDNLTFDLFNFTAAGLAEDLYMVDRNAVAFITKAINPETPTEFGGGIQQTRYRVASPTLPGISYDVYYKLNCKTVSGVEHIYHTWRIETRGGIFLNPERCTVTVSSVDYEPTGVLAFAKV
jgi:hypothetical protein